MLKAGISTTKVKIGTIVATNQLELKGGVTGGSDGSAWRMNFLLFLKPGEELRGLRHPILEDCCSLVSPQRGGVTRFCLGEPDFVTVVRLGELLFSEYFKKSGVSSSSALAFADSNSLWRFLPDRGDDCKEGVGGRFWSLLDCCDCRGVSKWRGERGAGCRNRGGEPLWGDQTLADRARHCCQCKRGLLRQKELQSS